MDIVAVTGSPHGPRGNTAALVGYVLEGAEKAGATTETVHLSFTRILPCKACDLCHERGHCPQDDEFEVVKRKILDADGLVLGTPNYIFSVSAQMKAFMDRCSSVVHCQAFLGKLGVSAVTSGGGEEQPIIDYLARFLLATGVVPVGGVWATMGGRDRGEIPPDARQAARDLGSRLVGAWQRQEPFPEARAIIEQYRERMRAVVEAHQEEWPFEHEYWKAFDPGTPAG